LRKDCLVARINIGILQRSCYSTLCGRYSVSERNVVHMTATWIFLAFYWIRSRQDPCRVKLKTQSMPVLRGSTLRMPAETHAYEIDADGDSRSHAIFNRLRCPMALFGMRSSKELTSTVGTVRVSIFVIQVFVSLRESK